MSSLFLQNIQDEINKAWSELLKTLIPSVTIHGEAVYYEQHIKDNRHKYLLLTLLN